VYQKPPNMSVRMTLKFLLCDESMVKIIVIDLSEPLYKALIRLSSAIFFGENPNLQSMLKRRNKLYHSTMIDLSILH